MYVLMSDTGVPMFSGTLIDYSDEQLNFIYWIKFYNYHVYSVEESERPAEYIIEYDCLFDEYLDRKQYKEKLQDSRGVKFANNMQDVIEFG